MPTGRLGRTHALPETLIMQPSDRPDDFYPYYEETVTERTWHLKAIFHIYGALRLHYAGRDDIFVGGNNFIYWEEGNRDEKQSPDVYVCFGARDIDRYSYKVWEENGIVPQVIFEITSKSTRFTDLGHKRGVYEMVGVEEYYLFDPLGEYLKERLVAYHRGEDGSYRPIRKKRVHSPRLNLDLRVEGNLLRLYYPGSSQRLPSLEEAEKARLEAERAWLDEQKARAEAERRADTAEREVQRLRDQLKQQGP